MGVRAVAMVLLQLYNGEVGGKKFLLSVDKDCTYRDLFKLMASKLELDSPTLAGYAVSQLASRDGAATRNLAISDNQLDLQRSGGGIYVWIRPGDQPEPEPEPEPESEPESEPEKKPEPVQQRRQSEPAAEAAAPPPKQAQPASAISPKPMMAARDSGAPPVHAPTEKISHFADTAAPSGRLGGARSPALSIRTEEYDVEYGKCCPMADAVNDPRYPVRYATTRNDPHSQPRVTTLRKPNGAKNWRSECLREGYSWTTCGKYHGMAEYGEKFNRTGRFKNVEAYPRFAGLSEEAQIKQIFKETIRAREKNATKSGGSPRSRKAVEETDRLLMSALKSSKQAH